MNQELFDYIAEFNKTVDAKLNYLTRSVTMLRNHMTNLFAMAVDCHNLPPATGHVKIKQDGCLQLLRQIDATLVDAGIQYFLGYGNLLGAARTGGFIPWDDDVDICLMRPDFDRAVAVLTEKFNHDKFTTTWGISGRIFKVMFGHAICVDLFPWDYYYGRINTPEKCEQFHIDYINAMQTARQKEREMMPPPDTPQMVYHDRPRNFPDYNKIRDEIIMHGTPPDTQNGDIFEGIDWQTYPERLMGFFHSKPFTREWIFPLGEIEFCGYKFPAPRNVNAWLTTRFGDWHAFKPDFARHSGGGIAWDEISELEQFIAGNIQ